MSHWRRFPDVMPDDYTDVLCYFGDHVPMVVCTFGHDLHAHDGIGWQTSGDDMHRLDANPTHWMPLPEAPQ